MLEIVPTSDPREVTCGTDEEQDRPGAAPRRSRTRRSSTWAARAGGVAKFVLGSVAISGDDFEEAGAVLASQGQLGSQEWTVSFQLDDDGSDDFAEATTAAVGSPPPTDQIAIVVDRVAISSPTGATAITGGSGEITGGFTEQSAKDLATQLNAGALPVELTRQSVRTVSPTLGEESLQQGSWLGSADCCCCCSTSPSITGSSASWRGSG